MKERFDYDGILKELFQLDHPSLLDQITAGAQVVQFLNVEFPRVLRRCVDLVFLGDDGCVHHVEFQAHNFAHIVYRQGLYCFLIGDTYPGRRVKQTVIYVGARKMSMRSGVDLGDTRGSFRLIDIRETDVDSMLRSGRPGDIALAILAGGGEARLPDIIRKAAKLKGQERERALAQIMVLSGLRGLPSKVELEMTRMGVAIDIEKHPVLMKWRREAVAEGRAEGRAEGKADLLLRQLTSKFGPLPKWASERIDNATTAQVERWAIRVITADAVEGVLGKR